MLAAIFFCGAMTTVCTACGDDKDDNGGNEQVETRNKAALATVWYDAQFGSDVLEVFDVDVTVTGPAGGTITKRLTKNVYSGAETEIRVTDAGLKYAMGIKVTPKADFTPDASKTYIMGIRSELTFHIMNAQMETLVGGNDHGVAFSENKIPGDKMTPERIQSLNDTYNNIYGGETLEVYKTYYVKDGVRKEY